jgi:glycerol-3-phosphate dehydrogenase (NAD(P)+)
MSERYSVLVLGYGEMGHAMEHLLRGRARLAIWEKWPQAGFQPVVLEEAARTVDYALFCLPAAAHRDVLAQSASFFKPDCVCVTIAKGLDEAGQTTAEIFQDVLGQSRPYAVLCGPMISEEIRADRHAFGQLGGSADGVYSRVRDLFAGTLLHVEYSSDVRGIAWAAILKNVYALAFGMADEWKLGNNMRGFLAVAALQELDRIAGGMGGRSGAAYRLAGLGDLITTGTSADSHHHELGRRLARGETQGISGEGIHTLNTVAKHRLFQDADYPLFELIRDIVQDPRAGRARFDAYLREHG